MTTIKWTNPRPGVWDSKDGMWRIERDGTYGGWGRGRAVQWRIRRWRPAEREWEPVPGQGYLTTLAKAKARAEEAKRELETQQA